MRYAGRMIFLLIILLAYPATELSAKGKIYLVSIGIADYLGTKNDLTLPAKDAATIEWLYRKNSKVESVLLINGEATKANVMNRMRQLFSKAASDDIIVMFFSGHGYKGGFVCYDGYIGYDEIKKVMAASASKNKMIFADACFSGKMRGNDKKNTSSPASSFNVMFFLSSRDNETSIERSSMKNGFFTTCLQRGLRGGADTDRNRIITAKELYEFVSAGVKKLSKDRQHPVMWGKFSDSMPVMVW